MPEPKIARPVTLTAEERLTAESALGASGTFAAPVSAVLEFMLAAINSYRQRCLAESGTGQCMYVKEHGAGHFNGIVSWYS